MHEVVLAGANEAAPPGLTENLLRAHARALEKLALGAPLGEILGDLTRVTENLNPNDSVAAILLLDDDGRLWTGAAPGLPEEYNSAIDGLVAEAGLGTCSHAAATGQVVITADIDACPRWTRLKSLPLDLGLVAAWSQPIMSRHGRVLGTFGTYFRERRGPTEIERRLVEALAQTSAIAIEQHRAQREREQQQRLLDQALEAAEMGAWQFDLGTNVCTFSPRAQTLYGLDAPHFLHDAAGVLRLIHADDVPIMWAAVARATDPAGDGRYNVEYRVPCDAGWRWLKVWGLTEFEADGSERRAVRLVGASRDITAAREAEARQQLLLNELNHRVKNNLAVVQSIAAQTLRSSPEPRLFADAFMGRISALARAHDLLTRSEWRGTDFGQLVDATLEPFGSQGAEVRAAGDRLRVAPETAVSLGLVLHELATNAAKYGGLSLPAGVVSLGWARRADGRGELVWTERGGPPVAAPSRKGFGSRLLALSIDQLGGSSEITFAPEGVVCRLVFPLANPGP